MESDISIEQVSETLQPQRESLNSTFSFEQEINEPTLDANQPPTWFRSTATKIADAWFDPKSFEQHPGLYEKLGVKTFKRFMPTGDLLYQSTWKKLTGFDMVRIDSPQSLKNMEIFTRVFESIHLAGFAVSAAEVGFFAAHQNVKPAVIAGALNILVNIYPIMVQRYNRVRLYRTINRMNKRDIKPIEQKEDPK